MTKEKLILISGVFITIASPIIFTSSSFCNGFDFTQTGQIGDTIGGLTAPIINIIGILLIYWSFEKQSDANKIQMEKNSFDILNSQFLELKEDIKGIELYENYNKLEKDQITERAQIEYHGYDVYEQLGIGIRDYGEHYLETSSDTFATFTYILFSMKLYLSEIEKSDLQDTHKEYLFRKFFYLYASNLVRSFSFIHQEASKIKEYKPIEIDLKNVMTLIDRLRKYSDI